MRIRMLKTRNWTVPSDRRVTIRYLEGKGYPIKRAWGEQLVADGEAVEVPTTPRKVAAPASARATKPRARVTKPRVRRRQAAS